MKLLKLNIALVFGLFMILLSCDNDAQDKGASSNHQISGEGKIIEKREDGHPKVIRYKTERDNLFKEVTYYRNGNPRIEGHVKNDKRTGLWKSYYKNGTLWSQASYKNNFKDGSYTTFYENGIIRIRGQYNLGNRTGIWNFYTKDGTLAKKIDYDNS